MIVDASDNMVANQAIATANSIGLINPKRYYCKAAGTSLPLDVRVRPWYNPDGITAYYMVPAILGVIVTMTMVIITAMAIVRERKGNSGTIDSYSLEEL